MIQEAFSSLKTNAMFGERQHMRKSSIAGRSKIRVAATIWSLPGGRDPFAAGTVAVRVVLGRIKPAALSSFGGSC
jgi:hypothetical protein